MISRRLLSIERHQKIIERIVTGNTLNFEILSKELNVSVMTIRRDVKELEKQGFLKSTRGGAYAQTTRSIDILLSPRAEDQGEAKLIIGKYAATLIEPGELIFIGPGSTTAQFVQFLKPELNLTVITASIPHASFLAAKGFKVISTGGEIATDDIAQTGYIAHDNIKRFFASKTIIGTRGVSKDVGLTDINSEIAQLSNLMVAQAEQVFVLADISKVGIKANYAICPLSEVDEIITTEDAHAAFMTECGDLCEILASK
ncbi:MAG: DeoR/GlpR family DNA-binding transcription regulator [Actinomycetota bacterium]|nr:DeoR/GlpR family DNA-binding transcription regulator [Actinomycetota bacterium]